jgi:peroxiredoxin (alkyl hydroperoxide reductase subunit C)
MPVPELQKPAPAFEGIAVVNGEFKNIKLSDFAGKYLPYW